MFAEPVWIPGGTIADSRKELPVERKNDIVRPGPLYLRRQRRAILTPNIVMKPLLSVVLISADDGFLWSHRVNIVSGDGPKRGEECNRFWSRAQRDISTHGNGMAP
jgi:hypothetical protein